MIADVGLATGYVVIVNVALVLPAWTMTLFGTLATEGWSLLNDTIKPLLGAGPLIVTVP